MRRTDPLLLRRTSNVNKNRNFRERVQVTVVILRALVAPLVECTREDRYITIPVNSTDS